MTSTISKGLHFEQVAQHWLKQQGLIFIENNYRCRSGEIDLIMMQKKTLCFIEVKYRARSDFGGAAYSISSRKQQKIIKTALYYISQKKAYQDIALRFDAVFIQRINTTSECDIEWIQSAFTAEHYCY